MQLIDTHVHINFDAFRPDLEQVAQAWREAGVVRLVHSCVDPSEFLGIQALADRFPEIAFAVGLHPLDVSDKWNTKTAAHILALAESDPRVVAIGETGLDFYKACNTEQQEQAFEQQLMIAHTLALPVIIHCRDATQSIVRLLKDFWDRHGAVAGVMHCWSGPPEETQQFLDLGFYISFSGIVTFKNAVQVKQSAQMVPRDRLLIETDCPFLSPVPKRKERRNQPANVRFVASHLADLRETPLEEISRLTTENACRLFRLSL